MLIHKQNGLEDKRGGIPSKMLNSATFLYPRNILSIFGFRLHNKKIFHLNTALQGLASENDMQLLCYGRAALLKSIQLHTSIYIGITHLST